MKCANHLGISQGAHGAWSTADKLGEECDAKLLSWKSEIEVHVSNVVSFIQNALRKLI